MSGMPIKAIGIWLVFVISAILNGVFREKVLVPAIGTSIALPLSGVILAALVFLVTLMLVPFINSSESTVYFVIGFLWVGLTLSFEFFFGRFVAGKSWPEIMQVLNVKKGDLFIFVLAITAVSPWVAAKLRGIL